MIGFGPEAGLSFPPLFRGVCSALRTFRVATVDDTVATSVEPTFFAVAAVTTVVTVDDGATTAGFTVEGTAAVAVAPGDGPVATAEATVATAAATGVGTAVTTGVGTVATAVATAATAVVTTGDAPITAVSNSD